MSRLRINRFIRFALWVSGYNTMTITVGVDMGFGEEMTVISKKP